MNPLNDNQKTEPQVESDSDHIVVQRRYDVAGAINDLLIAIWFLIGSFFFLSESLTYSGTWLFIVGSAQLMIKPIIKLVGFVHIGQIHPQLKRRREEKKVNN
ncbi:YrhK family protein [Marinomonas atlantica]|uniref:YrhK family protein n=1 Tax=Marinomonas atlantica TaxID=1806668 RepID=UPI00082B492E|nr:YrhK family protein [Marinomonas atlantica]MCO4784372.1 YrhK family protein [Marinomonas atlantica]